MTMDCFWPYFKYYDNFSICGKINYIDLKFDRYLLLNANNNYSN